VVALDDDIGGDYQKGNLSLSQRKRTRSAARPRGAHVRPSSDQELELALLDDTPAIWTGPHVGRRLTEAMRTLALLPMPGVGGYAAWPAYSYEWEDLLAQHEQGELERSQQLQNRIRLLPSSREVQRMEAAISWPAQHLAQLPPLLVAVNAVSLAHALDRDVGWVANKRGGYADTWRQRYDEGCSIIALGLRACRSPVF
jgi:hypothetical protein